MFGNISDEDIIGGAIRRRLKEVIDKAATEELEAAKKKLSERVPELAARVAVEIQAAMDYRNDDSIIQIRINKSRLLNL